MNALSSLPSLPPLAQPLIEARPLWPACGDPGGRGHGAASIERASGTCGAPRTGISTKTAQRLCDVAALATAAAFALPVGELTAQTRRSPYIAFARQSAMYIAHVAFGLSYSEVGRGFRRDRTTAAHACQLIEDRRDDPAIDAVLASLESACGSLRRRLAAPVRATVLP